MHPATTNQNAISTNVRQQQDPLISLPLWIQYLIGAYPQSKTNSRTYAILETHFSEHEPATMLDAVKQYVTENTFWPAISELMKYVILNTKKERHVMPFDWWHKNIYVPLHWHLCDECGEQTPDVFECPFCMDLEVAR